MTRHLYDDVHVAICRMLDRRYNNPLEDAPWPLLERLLGGGRVRVLDVGCGRGASSLAWAKRGAEVLGIDASEAMIAEAKRNLEAENGDFPLEFRCGRLEDLGVVDPFDLVLLHDVLCYLPDRAAALSGALGRLRPGGILSVTDYHGVRGLPEVDRVIGAWGIDVPTALPDWEAVLQGTGARVLMMVDTTRQYRAHWRKILARLGMRIEEMEERVGRPAVESFAAQVGAILAAVDTGAFGHFWAVLESP